MRFFRAQYRPMNRIEISAQIILENLAYLQGLQKGAEFFPVIKSHAYGHGIKEICQILEKSSVMMLAVDSLPEAQIAYKHSSKKILILGETLQENYKYFSLKRSEFCVYNIETFIFLASLKKNIHIHLFVNTGMNREGIQDIEEFLIQVQPYLKHVTIQGICSHLASADEDSSQNKRQEQSFMESLNILHENNIYPRYIHLGNSAGVFILKNPILNAFRTGIALYGYTPFVKGHASYKQSLLLRPALRCMSRVMTIQDIQKGEGVSYNETFIAKKNTKIAIVPFGYAEGLSRKLSNSGCFYNKEAKIPIVGNVCMNLTCCDITNIDIQKGDEIELISMDPKKENSIMSIAQKEETISYEVLVKLATNIRRNVVYT
jgi:alanine racemase